MWLRIRCTLDFHITEPAPFVLMLRPRSGAQQWISREEYRLNPSVPVYEFTDIYGNLCQRLTAPLGSFQIHTNADVMTADVVDTGFGEPFVNIQQLPDAVLAYLLPSRYCESDRFHDMASQITLGQRPGYNQVATLVNCVRERIRYLPGESQTLVSASEVNLREYGVCRDLSHLGIAMCRSLSIPARLVVGYLHELAPMDLHAWFEAYVGGRWYSFDATQESMRPGYVALGYGRDAADVAVYSQFGPPVYPIRQEVDVQLFSG